MINFYSEKCKRRKTNNDTTRSNQRRPERKRALIGMKCVEPGTMYNIRTQSTYILIWQAHWKRLRTLYGQRFIPYE